MKRNLEIACLKNNISLHSIKKNDIANLRDWKNANRNSFFYKEIITDEQQIKWYEGYTSRDNDFMFMVLVKGNPIGCLGFRKKEAVIDLYNIIRGVNNVGHGEMHVAFYMMLNYIKDNYQEDIQCDVLIDNVAVNWYKKTGFAIYDEKEYYVMRIDKNEIPTMELIVKEANND